MSLVLHEHVLELMSRPDLDQRLIVSPLLDRERQIGPATIDLRLGTEFLEPPRRRGALDPIDVEARGMNFEDVESGDPILVPMGQSIALHPGQLILGCSLEFVRLPSDIGGQVLSRSSWGRVGLVVATAVTMQPGWAGMITLELANLGNLPITLYPGLRVAQLVLWQGRPTSFGYDSATTEAKYSAPLGPQGSRLFKERDELQRIKAIADKLGVHQPTTIAKSEADSPNG